MASWNFLILISCFGCVSLAFKDALVDDDCLQCICRGLTGCDTAPRCHVMGDQEFCGPFDQSRHAWDLAGRRLVRGDNDNNPDAWKNCLNDYICAAKTVKELVERNPLDCNRDGRLNCLDFGMVAMLGPNCEDTTARGNLFIQPHYQKFLPCATRHYLNALRAPSTTGTTNIPTTSAGTTEKPTTSAGTSTRPTTEEPPVSSSPGEPTTVTQVLTRYQDAFTDRQRLREEFEDKLISRGVLLQQGTYEYAQAQIFSPLQEFSNFVRSGQQMMDLTELLADEFAWDAKAMFLRLIALEGDFSSIPAFSCPAAHDTSATKRFRSVDGSGNNVQEPLRGAAGTAYHRRLATAYGDGYGSLRVSTTGAALPSAHTIASRLVALRPAGTPSQLSSFTAVWGRFINRDMFYTAVSSGRSNYSISCCPDGADPALLHPDCAPIAIAAEGTASDCLPYVRAAATVPNTCRFFVREQMSMTSSFLDGSHIYGATVEKARSLRQSTGGQVRTTFDSGLPPPGSNVDVCFGGSVDTPCFDGGDLRVNEDLLLALLHTLWLRQHNKLARELSDLNPAWNDERLYQVSRKMVGAQIQHITYNEYLPALLGSKVPSPAAPPSGHSNNYDPSVNPATQDFYASTISAFVDSLTNDDVIEKSSFGTLIATSKFSEVSPKVLLLQKKDIIENLINGLASQGTDASFSTTDEGLRLLALNIQRGRDHGIKSYTAWRKHCNPTETITTFKDLTDSTAPVPDLSQLYASVGDIDVLVGALLEPPVEGAAVGRTLSCLLQMQFNSIKNGDRFYYENGGADATFSAKKLQEIRKTSLARVLCDNSFVQSVQAEVLRVPTPINKRVACNDLIGLPTMDLSVW